MNYYRKYLKYKLKYLNLLNKTKRVFDKIETNETNETNKKKKYIDKDSVLSGLFNLFVTEPIYEPISAISSIKNTKQNEIINTNKDKMEIDKDKNYVQDRYNLRGKKFVLRREDEDFYIGSYTPEIIRNLKSNRLSTQLIDKLVLNFKHDDIENIESLNKQNTLYVNFDNYGKNIECWVADNMNCPCCGEKTLRRYVRDNMPCIDLICTNQKHDFVDGVKFFQVKSKSFNVTNELYKNFDLEKKQIHTGSKAIGKYIHDIKIQNDYYTLLIGYICIEYIKEIKEPDEIIRILPSSFIVLPKIYIPEAKVLFSSDEQKLKPNSKLDLDKVDFNFLNDENDELYYWYINNEIDANIIEFSTINNDVIMIKQKNLQRLFGYKYKMYFISTDYNPSLNKWIISQNPFV